MNRARLSTLAAGLLGYALDAATEVLRLVGRVLLRAPEQRCVACFNAFDPALIRGDGRCGGCHRDARGSVAPAPRQPNQRRQAKACTFGLCDGSGTYYEAHGNAAFCSEPLGCPCAAPSLRPKGAPAS